MNWKEISVAVAASFLVVETVMAIQPPFPEAWTSAFESVPADTEQESLGAGRIRDLKVQIRQRMQQEFSWNGDGNDGYNEFVALLQQQNDPAPQFDLSLTGGELYTKLVGSVDEVFYRNNFGNVQQITNNGQLNTGVSIPSGTVAWTASSTIPGTWDACDGSLHSRVNEANLFAAIGTTYGAGDGQTTFGVPDVRGRTIYNFDNGNGTGRLTAAVTGGLSASALGNTGGVQSEILAASMIPTITFSGSTAGGAVTPSGNALATGVGGGSGGDTFATDSGGLTYTLSLLSIPAEAVSGSSTNTGGLAHNDVSPGIILQCMIKQ